jgi:ATP synthase regulation
MSDENTKSAVKFDEIKYDREGIPMDDPRMKGLSRYFNNSTIRGRANVAKATFLGLFGFYLYKKFQKPSPNPNDVALDIKLKDVK